MKRTVDRWCGGAPAGRGNGRGRVPRRVRASAVCMLVLSALLFAGAGALEAGPADTPPPAPARVEKDEETALSPLEAELARLKRALSLREEAERLEDDGDLPGAAAKYRESLPMHADPAVEAYIIDLEERAGRAAVAEEPTVPAAEPEGDPRSRAEAVWRQAAELQLAERYEEALVKYHEGLSILHDTVVEEHVRKLEKFIQRRKK